MKRNVIGLFLLATLFVVNVRADESSTVPANTGATVGATDAGAATSTTDAKTFLSSIVARVMKPVNWTKENAWDAYPRTSAAVATFVAVWAACRMYKPLGQALFGCKAERKQEVSEYSF